jgi:hypothetical protein
MVVRTQDCRRRLTPHAERPQAPCSIANLNPTILALITLQEATVELSLAAEALQEALATDYGGALCDHLLAER